jgi:O-antigen/teichoic acid export membrane protein
MIKLRNILSTITKNIYFKNLTTLTIGAVFAQSIGIFAAPILSRIYSPEDYGVYAIFASVVTILSTIFPLRYESKIIVPKDDDEVNALLLVIFYSTIILGSLIFVLTLFSSDILYKKIGIFKLGFWLKFTILAAICTAITNSFYYYLVKKNNFKHITYSRIFTSLISTIFAITLGLNFINSGLIISQIISLTLGLAFVILISNFKFPKKINQKKYLFRIASKHKSAPLYLLPTSLVDVFSYQLQIFLIALWFKTSDVGSLRMSWTILALPASFIGSAIGQLFFQKFSNIWFEDIKYAKKFLLITWRNLFLVGLLPCILIVFFGKELFIFFLGQKWVFAGEIAAIMAPMFFITFISSPTSTTYISLGIEKIGFYLSLIVLITRPLSLYIGMINNNLKLGIYIFVFLEIVNIVIYQVIALYHINKKKHESIFRKKETAIL